MHSLTKIARADLTKVVNTILYARMQMDDFARRGQWKRYHKARDAFNQAILDLNDRFQVETIIHRQINELIVEDQNQNPHYNVVLIYGALATSNQYLLRTIPQRFAPHI